MHDFKMCVGRQCTRFLKIGPVRDIWAMDIWYIVCEKSKLVAFLPHLYRAMHFSAYARSWDRMSSVRLSVTLVDCDHIGWKSWKLIAGQLAQHFALCSQKAIHLIPGEHGENLGRLEVG